jgi:hypothetical protein
LTNEINNNSIILETLDKINAKNDDLDIYFLVSLSAPEQSELSNIIAQHNPIIPIDIDHEIINDKIVLNSYYTNKIISGNLSHDINMIFNSTEIEYLIENVYYKSPKTQIILDASDFVNPHIDIIYVNTSNIITKQTGIASTNPVSPLLQLNEMSILQLYIPASSIEPNNISKYTTFTLSETTSGVRVNLTSIVDPNSAPNSIETANIQIGDRLILNLSATTNISNYSIFEFLYKSKEYWGAGKIRIILYNCNVLNGLPVILENGKFGLNSYDFNNYQRIMIDIRQFNLTQNLITRIEFEFLTTNINCFLDDFSLQTGLTFNTKLTSKFEIANFSNEVINEVKENLNVKDILPTTTKGDLIVDNGTNIVRLGAGGNG